ncbi:MAG TPA: periplasmic heavy metal sensor [Thermodesulfobacteriota bacterium]|nr:periplasmic heavy metal sensor [Deltaproteobacteria bacterium]HNR11816.1 periplasmic heavy metal sensor [Thermodesulfobacteriota bacterium]HNU70534.1 periplasmic heavy metal sensor [Thermodesulfobacteriota bacterium]HOC38709.1 periplasmic heavy metal sensor [Thermodesulfobacteriota bacterium]
MKKIVSIITLCLVTALLIGGSALAGSKNHGPSDGKRGFDRMMCGKMFHKNFFPPEMIMRHQQEIGLTEEQKTYMKTQTQEAESTFTSLEWDLHDAIGTLDTLTAQQTPDEKQVLAQLDKVLSLENKIKRARLTLMIRLKNKLTPEQQAKLVELKGKQHRVHGKHGYLYGGTPPCMEKKPYPMTQEKNQPAS